MKKWYTLYALFVIFRRLGRKISHSITFLILPRPFLDISDFLCIYQIGCHEFFQQGSNGYYTTTQREESSVFNTIKAQYLEFLPYYFITVY